MKSFKTFMYAVLAGICIGIGGIAFLAIDNKVIGALFFTVGLFTILTNGFNLFTGKLCCILENPPSYCFELLIIWLGNLAGTGIAGSAVRASRIAALSEKALKMCEVKLNDNLMSIFILAIFCNILMYVAVDGFKHNKHESGKYIGLFLGVAGFILCGFEHCVANMFYFSAADVWSFKTLIYLLVMTFGNIVGGLLFPAVKLLK